MIKKAAAVVIKELFLYVACTSQSVMVGVLSFVKVHVWPFQTNFRFFLPHFSSSEFPLSSTSYSRVLEAVMLSASRCPSKMMN